MPQYTPAPTPPPNAQLPAQNLSQYTKSLVPTPPQDTKPSATNITNHSGPPNPQTSKYTYNIVWLWRTMEDTAVQDRIKFVAINGLDGLDIVETEAFRGQLEEIDKLRHNERAQNHFDHSITQSSIPFHSYPVIVRLQYGFYWAEYAGNYTPSTKTFSVLRSRQATEKTAAEFVTQNRELYQELTTRNIVMEYLDVPDDNGENFLSMIFSDRYPNRGVDCRFICKMRSAGRDGTLSQQEMERLGIVKRLTLLNSPGEWSGPMFEG
ncbi:hypothetical protein N7G274_003430 [Stereocaulon virgatum]|uniref:Uncharacterized protein n=1 Tax=Stereocaulon virgatum TaxID=373712 RepID=A0ABR4ADR7_9LECA